MSEMERLFQTLQNDPLARDPLIKKLEARRQRRLQYYKHQSQYKLWLKTWSCLPTVTESTNIDIAKRKASVSYWGYTDLLNSPTFQSIKTATLRERDVLSNSLWQLNESRITAEAETLAQVRMRKAEERERSERVESLKKYWLYLTEVREWSGEYSVPPLNIFFSLPFVRTYEKTRLPDPKAEFDTPVFGALIDREIQVWSRSTRRILGAALGYKRTGERTKETQDEDLDSFLDRATSLFECSKCRRTGSKYEQRTTMTHLDLIGHRCPKGTIVKYIDTASGEERTKVNRDWNVHNFVPDEVAIAATRLAFRVADPPLDESTEISRFSTDE
ncbi:hypothetical protein FRB90_010131, partial [Tulasnella sp. 427]